MASDGPSPHSRSLRFGLPAPQPSRRHHAQSLLGPHFMTQERIMFSNATPSESRLSPAATMSDATPSSLTPAPLHCASILQPTTVAFEFRPSLLQFVSIVSPHDPSLRFGLPAPQPSRRHHAQSLLAPHFMTQEHIMFSNPTPSESRLSPAATMSDATPSSHTPSWHCASILQPAAHPQVVAFES